MKRKTKQAKKAGVFVGSGNVFKDLGFANAEEHLAKAEIASKIYTLIEKSKMSQAQAAKILAVDPARVSNLMRGRLAEFSMERLFQFLNKLGQDIEVSIRPKREQHASFHVVACA
ncbi:MAG TPA: helix-turn-helix transcriptional regulator [Tepidisphaeraceae bacterium]|jgi:predicted XRE-type DNA-binding protein